MPRNASGVYSQPAGTTAVPNQPISSSAYNTLIGDIGSEITASLPRDGSAPMVAPLTLASANPTTDNQAARKKYVDDKAAAATPADGSVTTAKIAANAVAAAKIDFGAWTNVASAATVDLGAQASRNVVITGTTTITSFGTTGPADNVPYLLRFAASPLITNSASLICQAGVDIQAAAGDMALVVHDSATVWRIIHFPAIPKASPPSGHLYGLTTAYVSTTSFSVAAGTAASEGSASVSLLRLTSSLTKTLSAWAAGTGAGSLDTGTIAATTWYHVHLISSADGATVDVLLSLSATAPTMPSGYTGRRRIGSIKTNISAQITTFVQAGNRFRWAAQVLEADVINQGTAAITRTLAGVPTGVVVFADLLVGIYGGSSYGQHLVTPLSLPDVAPPAVQGVSSAQVPMGVVAGYTAIALWDWQSKSVATNTSAQVRSRIAVSGAQDHAGIITVGWTDDRGAI